MSYSAYQLTEESRNKLLDMVQPIHSRVIADHITYKFPSSVIPPKAISCLVMLEVHDDQVQAVGVSLKYHDDNISAMRSDGKMYHITISVDPDNGGKPVMSNNLLATSSGTPVDTILELDVVPVVL